MLLLQSSPEKSEVLIYSWQSAARITNGEEIKGCADLEMTPAAPGVGGASWR